MKIFKNKIFITFLFVFILTIINNSNVLASFEFTYNETSYSLPELPFDTSEHPDYVILYNYKEDYYQVGYPSADYQTPFYYQTSKNSLGKGVQYWSADDTEKVVVGPTSSNGLHWNYYDTTKTTYDTWSAQKTTAQNQMKTTNNVACAYVVYSSTDIINENGTIFFQVPVTETPEPETPEKEEQETLTTTIPALETAEQIPEAMTQTLKIVIPVGLVIFGIVLLISLIKSVISRMT